MLVELRFLEVGHDPDVRLDQRQQRLADLDVGPRLDALAGDVAGDGGVDLRVGEIQAGLFEFGLGARDLDLGDVGLGTALGDLLRGRLGGRRAGPRPGPGRPAARCTPASAWRRPLSAAATAASACLTAASWAADPLPRRGHLGLGHPVLRHRLVQALLRDGMLRAPGPGCVPSR